MGGFLAAFFLETSDDISRCSWTWCLGWEIITSFLWAIVATSLFPFSIELNDCLAVPTVVVESLPPVGLSDFFLSTRFARSSANDNVDACDVSGVVAALDLTADLSSDSSEFSRQLLASKDGTFASAILLGITRRFSSARISLATSSRGSTCVIDVISGADGRVGNGVISRYGAVTAE